MTLALCPRKTPSTVSPIAFFRSCRPVPVKGATKMPHSQNAKGAAFSSLRTSFASPKNTLCLFSRTYEPFQARRPAGRLKKVAFPRTFSLHPKSALRIFNHLRTLSVTLLHYFALPKMATTLFSIASALLVKKHPGWGCHLHETLEILAPERPMSRRINIYKDTGQPASRRIWFSCFYEGSEPEWRRNETGRARGPCGYRQGSRQGASRRVPWES